VIKELAGYRDDEIASTREAWFSLVHPEDRPLVLAKARACVEGERDALEFEHRLLCRDGSVRWILTRGSAERDAHGKVTRLVGTDSDITDRVRAEHAVRQSEARFAQFVEA